MTTTPAPRCACERRTRVPAGALLPLRRFRPRPVVLNSSSRPNSCDRAARRRACFAPRCCCGRARWWRTSDSTPHCRRGPTASLNTSWVAPCTALSRSAARLALEGPAPPSQSPPARLQSTPAWSGPTAPWASCIMEPRSRMPRRRVCSASCARARAAVRSRVRARALQHWHARAPRSSARAQLRAETRHQAAILSCIC